MWWVIILIIVWWLIAGDDIEPTYWWSDEMAYDCCEHGKLIGYDTCNECTPVD
jgi:hypothetical protein